MKIALVLLVFGAFTVLASLGIRAIVRVFEQPHLEARIEAERRRAGIEGLLGALRYLIGRRV
jgi:hypothetical protein